MEKVVLGGRTVHLRSFNLSELEVFLQSLGAPRYRAKQIMDWLHKKHVTAFLEMKNIPKELQKILAEKIVVGALELVDVVNGTGSVTGQVFFRAAEAKPVPARTGTANESIKYLMKTQDGHVLESVLIAQAGRRTVCLSTQLGCRIRCPFCASGKGRFGRNLSAGEIVEQVSVISRHLAQGFLSFPQKRESRESLDPRARGDDRALVTNIVFMGIGEPLDNYEATMRAIEILTADWGFELGGRRITVSTSGMTPMIEKFVNDSRGRVRLSVSLHSSNQETRSKLVPINKKYHLDELIKTLENIHKVLKREITFEYTLIEGINDSDREARGVGKIAARLGAKVNLIPYNPIREMDFQTPSRERIEAFRDLLEKRNVRVTVRQTAGRAIDAACGQLRLDRTRIPLVL
jgi:23S rRNA (adenine2503-C2)-methyltransferase